MQTYVKLKFWKTPITFTDCDSNNFNSTLFYIIVLCFIKNVGMTNLIDFKTQWVATINLKIPNFFVYSNQILSVIRNYFY